MVNYTPRLREAPDLKVHPVYIKSFMQKNFRKLNPDADMTLAMKLIIESHLSGIVITDEQHRPHGFLSAKDCLKIGLDAKYLNAMPGKVSEYMTKKVITISEDCELHELIEFFTQSHLRVLPVVNEFGAVVGIVDRNMALRELDCLMQATW